MNTIASRRLLPAACLALMLGVSAPVQAQTLLLEYTFNDSGTTTANSGSQGGSATMYQSDTTTLTDSHGIAGSGVSGLAGDLALNLSGATAMGSAGTGPITKGGSTSLSSLTSFTITGWLNSSVALNTAASSARLFDFGDRAKVYLSTSGLTISVSPTGDYGSAAIGNGLWSTANQWVFYAITYDGTSLRFYAGSSALTLTEYTTASTLNLPGLSLGTSGNLVIGNNTAGTRPFDGLLDDFRIYGSTTDASGALSMAALDNIRALDVVPEPSSLALLLAGAVALLRRRPRSANR